MSHANARLTVHGRAELIRRVVELGRPVAHVVIELNVSRATGYKWLARWRAEGLAGLADRTSRAHRLPGKTSSTLEAQVLALRAARKLGPARIGPLVGLAPSTVHAVLRRHGMHRLAWLDRPTGQLVRRYERARPGELVHVDVKKLGVIRPGGGGACTAAARPSTTTAAPRSRRAGAWATTTSTALSTTTPDWPTPRSIPTRPRPPARRSSDRRRPGSQRTASTASSE